MRLVKNQIKFLLACALNFCLQNSSFLLAPEVPKTKLFIIGIKLAKAEGRAGC
jgi:hypothetical protein